VHTIECSGRCVLELDDYQTQRRDVIRWLYSLKAECPDLKVTLFTLLGPSDFRRLEELAHKNWIDLALHGWDHFSEWRWGYWEMRHYLEMVEDLGFFIPIFKMPWNRWPRPGALKALKENGWGYATPRRLQWPLLKCFGLEVYKGKLTVLLHPCDLKDIRLELSAVTQFCFVKEELK